MECKEILVFNYTKSLSNYFKTNPKIKDDYFKNISDCFLYDNYNVLSEQFKKQTTYEDFKNDIFKNYYCTLQTNKEKKDIIKTNNVYRCVVLGVETNKLLFSCSLEVGVNYVEIHDVCVGKSFIGQGLCKKYIYSVVEYIKQNYTNKKIIIMCYSSNTPACKCYTSIFGKPVRRKQTREGELTMFQIIK